MYLSFYFNYLFGHLCVHNWACEGILKASIIRKYFGGKQQNMRNKVILGEDGFLVPYDCIFQQMIPITCGTLVHYQSLSCVVTQ